MRNSILKMGFCGLFLLNMLFMPACEKAENRAAFRAYSETFLEESLSRERLTVLAEALEAYYLTFGEYPAELKALYENGFITKEELSHPWQKNYNYRRLSAQKEHTALGRLPEPAWQLALPTN